MRRLWWRMTSAAVLCVAMMKLCQGLGSSGDPSELATAAAAGGGAVHHHEQWDNDNQTAGDEEEGGGRTATALAVEEAAVSVVEIPPSVSAASSSSQAPAQQQNVGDLGTPRFQKLACAEDDILAEKHALGRTSLHLQSRLERVAQAIDMVPEIMDQQGQESKSPEQSDKGSNFTGATANPGILCLSCGLSRIADGVKIAVGVLANGVASVVQNITLMWSDVAFDLEQIPPDQQQYIVVSQEPLLVQSMICENIPALLNYLGIGGGGRGLHYSLINLCAYKNAPMQRVWSAPCRTRTFTAWFEVSGKCHAIGDHVTVRANPYRHPCIYLDTDSAADWISPLWKETDVRMAMTSLFKDSIIGTTAGSTNTNSIPKQLALWIPGNVPLYCVHMFTGIIILCLTQWLTESRWFHYLLSAILGTTLITVLVAYLFYSELHRRFVAAIPGGSFIPGLSIVMLFFSPVNQGIGFVDMLLWGTFYFWNNGAFGYDWLGKAFFLFSAGVGLFVTHWYQLFSIPSSNSTAYLCSGWTNGRMNLKRCLTVIGLYQMLLGASDVEVALAVTLIVSYLDTVLYWRRRINIWIESEYSHCVKMTSSDAEKIAHSTTRKELERLREYVNEHPDSMLKLSQQGLANTTAFKEGCHDYVPNQDLLRKRSWCIIM